MTNGAKTLIKARQSLAKQLRAELRGMRAAAAERAKAASAVASCVNLAMKAAQ